MLDKRRPCTDHGWTQQGRSSYGHVEKHLLTKHSPEAVGPLYVAQEALAGILTSNAHLRSVLKCSTQDSLLTEARINLQSARAYRKLNMMQQSLTSITYLSLLAKQAKDHGLRIDAAIQKETADVLWDRGELVGSIKTLQSLIDPKSTEQHSIDIGRAGLLADLVSD